MDFTVKRESTACMDFTVKCHVFVNFVTHTK